MASSFDYKVRKGDTLPKIAKMHFIADWKKEIWLAPFNKALRAKTKTPDYIQPGWIIQVPIIKMKPGDLYASVGGAGAFNRPSDVSSIKALLNKHLPKAGSKKLSVNGKPDRRFVEAIKEFQSASGMPATGVISPKDKTLAALNKAPSRR